LDLNLNFEEERGALVLGMWVYIMKKVEMFDLKESEFI